MTRAPGFQGSVVYVFSGKMMSNTLFNPQKCSNHQIYADPSGMLMYNFDNMDVITYTHV